MRRVKRVLPVVTSLPPNRRVGRMFHQKDRRSTARANAGGRVRRGLTVAAAVAMIGLTSAWSQTEPPLIRGTRPISPVAVETNPSGQGSGLLLREGTELTGSRGYFRIIENRVIFFSRHGDFRYTGLENLNLERIVAEVTRNPTQLEWSVSGTVTEFRGTNYLFIRRAILSRAPADAGASSWRTVE